MGTRPIEIRDVRHGRHGSRLRLLAPLRYLKIWHPEKTRYDYTVPLVLTIIGWAAFSLVNPKIPMFGDAGILRYTRDLLIMGVPFMIGALAAVAMGSPGKHLDQRLVGSELMLDGEFLTLRRFVCYLLGYLSLLGMATLVGAIAAQLLHDTIVAWLVDAPRLRAVVMSLGALTLFYLLSALNVTVLWSLYFLTDIVNQAGQSPSSSDQ